MTKFVTSTALAIVSYIGLTKYRHLQTKKAAEKEIIEEMQKLKRVRGVDCMSLKRIKLMLFSAIILVGLFFFIQIHQTRNVEKQKTSNIVGKLLIDTTGKEEPIVLNPLETKNHRTMILPYLKEEQNECLIDLSFLGFDKKLKLTAYDIGYITENNESSCIQVSSKGGVNATDSKEKKSNGNCLILVVSNQIKSIDSDNYIVVLDYLLSLIHI